MAWKVPKVSEVPAGAMMPQGRPATRRHDPFAEMRAELDRVFESFLGRGPLARLRSPPAFPEIAAPDVDVRETEREIVVEAELPGMEEKDISVVFRDGILSLSGEKKSERDEKEDTYHLVERSYGSFERSFRLPDTIDQDKISASLDKGVLRVVVPKRSEAVSSEKKIPVGKK
jgi:HSP20 family protein